MDTRTGELYDLSKLTDEEKRKLLLKDNEIAAWDNSPGLEHVIIEKEK